MIGGDLKLSLPGLIVGSIVPDLEVPIVYLLTRTQDRLILHSFLGGLTLGTIITVALIILLYPFFISKIFPVDKRQIKEKCRISTVFVFSCFIGVLSHILLDVTNHSYNPLFWPFQSASQTPSPIVPMLGGELTSSFIVHGSMIILTIGLLFNFRHDLCKKTFIE